MELNQLLVLDPDAAHYFDTLPPDIQQSLLSRGGAVGSLAALREYADNLVAQSASHYNGLTGAKNGIPLDPDLAAEWTRRHQA